MNQIYTNAWKNARWIITTIESDPGTYLINKMWRLRNKMYKVSEYCSNRINHGGIVT